MNFPKLIHYWRLTSIVHILLLSAMVATLLLLPNPWYYPFVLGFQAILTLIVLGGAIWLTPQRLIDLRQRIQAYTLPLIIIFLACCVGIGLTGGQPIIYGVSGVATPLTFGLMLWTFYPDKPLYTNRWLWIALTVIVVTIIGIRVYTLSIFPPIHRTDEGWALSWSVNYALSGQIDDPLMKVDLPSYELRYANMQLGRFGPLAGLWLRLVGIGFWELRLFNFLLILVITALISAVAYNWYGRSAAWCTAIAMFGSTMLMRLADTRLDTGYTLAMVLALYLSSEADKRQKLGLHFLAGLAAGLGVFSHLHAIGFGVVLTIALYLPRYITGLRQRQWLPPKSAVFFALGGILVGIALFAGFILPNLAGFLETVSSRGSFDRQGFFYALGMNLLNLYLYSNVEFFLLLIGVSALVMRRQARDWNLLLLVLGLHLILSIIAPTAYDHYLRPLAPIYALIIGAFFSQVISKRHLESLNWAQALTVASTAVVLVLYSLRPSLAYILEGGTLRLQPTPAIEWIQANVQPDERILAPTEYYLWLPQYTNMRSIYLERLQNRELRLNLPGEQIWDAVEARYIVYDSTQREDMLPESLFESDYLAQNGYTAVATIEQEDGVVIIYQRQNP